MSIRNHRARGTQPAPAVRGLVPIVVGVTGHRDIPHADGNRLRSAVTQQLAQIAAAYPSSPCLLLSGLAEGADRLAARCALSLGWQVGAVLPRPQADYERDFADDASRADFRALLVQCAWTQVVSPLGTPRIDSYLRLGEWLAAHSQQGLALWNGVPSEAPGGTADVVRLFREGLPQEHPMLPDARPVIQVLTRRTSDLCAIPTDAVGSVTRLDPQPAGMTAIGEDVRWGVVLQRIDGYNCDARTAIRNEPAKIGRTRQHLNSNDPLDDTGLCTAADGASWLYATASIMSAIARAKRDSVFLCMIACAVVAMFFEQLYSGPFSIPMLLAAAITTAALGVGLNWYADHAQLETRYLDYRALAEACRVQYFWKRAGVSANASDYYLRDQRDELEWLRQAVICTELRVDEVVDISLDLIARIRCDWIDNQLTYFAGQSGRPGSADKNRVLDQRWSRRASRLLWAGVTITLITVIFHALAADALGETGDAIVQSLIVSYGLLFAGAGVCKVYQENRAYSEQANRYRRMALSLQLARRQIDDALLRRDLARAQQALIAIGCEALAENGNWLLVHRERPVQVPLRG